MTELGQKLSSVMIRGTMCCDQQLTENNDVQMKEDVGTFTSSLVHNIQQHGTAVVRYVQSHKIFYEANNTFFVTVCRYNVQELCLKKKV